MATLDEACLGQRSENPFNADPIVTCDHGIFPDASVVLKVGDVLHMQPVPGGPVVRARVVDIKPGYVEYIPC